MEKQAIHPYPATQPCKGVNVFVPLDDPQFAQVLRDFGFALRALNRISESNAVERAAKWTADSEAFPAIAGSVDSAANGEGE
jgi:hypothetical protein